MNELKNKTTLLNSFRNKFGDVLTILYDIEVVGNDRGIYVFAIEDSGMWAGDLELLLIDWYTDEDFESGVFEEPYELEKLKALNDLMATTQYKYWNFEKANMVLAYEN